MTISTLLAVSTETLALLGGIILLAGIVLTVMLQRQRNNVWRQFALKHGLATARNARGRRIIGDVSGRRITLETVDESSDTGPLGVEEMRMSLDVDFPTWPLGLRIESATNVIGDLETHSTITGNESFDRDLLVLGRDRASACGWLTDDRRLALMNLTAHHNDKRMTLKGDRLALQTRNAISSLQELDDMLDSLVQAADVIETRDDEPSRGQDEMNTVTSTR